jgi:hypothetical protein
MSISEATQGLNTGYMDPGWKPLYRITGYAVLIMLTIIPIQLIVFSVSPPPGDALGWFALFQDSKLMGLLSFELLFIVYGVLSIPVILALYITLRRTHPTLTLLYLGLSIVGTAALLMARPAFEMLHLSDQYALATTEAQRVILLAAGEAMLSVFHGTTYLVSYVLASITGFIISIVMLKTNIFNKATAYIRIVSSVLDFGLFIPAIGIFLSAISAMLLLVWNILISRRFFQLGRGEGGC